MENTRNIPFKAALFDLDGTLLDSMYVWHRVDELFFQSRKLCLPEDYGRALAGKSYRESAEYTIERFGLNETWEDVVEEWTRMSENEYAHHVKLKPGALEYLRMLKRAGVKLAIATALPPSLYRLTLEHHGIIDMFDALCSTNDVGGRGKISGEVFLLAAERLGVLPEDCAVFEDVWEGIAGAKKVGMRAYCMKDAAQEKSFDRIAEIADGMLDSMLDMERYHDLPENGRRCVIFTARCDGDVKKVYKPREDDYVLCADGGYVLANVCGVRPDCILGDFDSASMPESDNVEYMPSEYRQDEDGGYRKINDSSVSHTAAGKGEGKVLRYASEKMYTDTMMCLRHGLALGFDDFLIVGGFGGRIDHTIANLQALKYAAMRRANAVMYDGDTWATVITDGEKAVPNRNGKLSVFAMDALCSGIWLRDVKYPLENAILTNDITLGISNEFLSPDENGVAKDACIRVDDGSLLITVCDDR